MAKEKAPRRRRKGKTKRTGKWREVTNRKKNQEKERRKARKERMKNKIKTRQDQHECTNKLVKIKETK